MEQKETRPQGAQPADEEIKKHGDPLSRLVRDAAEEEHSEEEASAGNKEKTSGKQ